MHLYSPLLAAADHARPYAAPAEHLALDFPSIYKAWFSRVLGWVRKLGGPHSDHEDLAQEVFVIVHRRLKDFDGVNPGGWIYRITQRQVRDFRRRSWFRHRGFESPSEALAHPGANPLEILEADDLCKTAQRAVLELSQEEASTLYQYEVEGLSGEEISVRDGICINTTWSHLRRARTKVRQAVSRESQALS